MKVPGRKGFLRAQLKQFLLHFQNVNFPFSRELIGLKPILRPAEPGLAATKNVSRKADLRAARAKGSEARRLTSCAPQTRPARPAQSSSSSPPPSAGQRPLPKHRRKTLSPCRLRRSCKLSSARADWGMEREFPLAGGRGRGPRGGALVAAQSPGQQGWTDLHETAITVIIILIINTLTSSHLVFAIISIALEP